MQAERTWVAMIVLERPAPVRKALLIRGVCQVAVGVHVDANTVSAPNGDFPRCVGVWHEDCLAIFEGIEAGASLASNLGKVAKQLRTDKVECAVTVLLHGWPQR